MRIFVLFLALISLFACKEKVDSETKISTETEEDATAFSSDFTMVFASCNDQKREQPLWNEIRKHKPKVFIWGGDNVYSDTDDMAKMAADYNMVSTNPDYAALASETKVIGTWDDHDYGLNDGGVEWKMKDEAKNVFLNFLNVAKTDPLRQQEGLYHAKVYTTPKGKIKVLLLDTRYFRSELKKSDREGWRYEPWNDGKKRTVLGDAQWQWLEKELQDDSADFNIIVSSIQYLNYNHGWEKWGNFPSEVEKLKNMITEAKAKNIMILSGDRHQAEISVMQDEQLGYPLVDFTSSGLTHVFPDGLTETSEYRVGDVYKALNFGVLHFDFDHKQVQFEIRGVRDTLYETLKQQYQ